MVIAILYLARGEMRPAPRHSQIPSFVLSLSIGSLDQTKQSSSTSEPTIHSITAKFLWKNHHKLWKIKSFSNQSTHVLLVCLNVGAFCKSVERTTNSKLVTLDPSTLAPRRCSLVINTSNLEIEGRSLFTFESALY